MTELLLPSVSKERAKSPKRGFAFKAALCIGGVLMIVTIRVLWAEISEGSKAAHKLVVSEGVAAQTVPIAKASRENLTKDISLYGEFRPYQEILVHAKVSG